ncbi:MAG: lactonase family protein [Spirosomataceae bacterium]
MKNSLIFLATLLTAFSCTDSSDNPNDMQESQTDNAYLLVGTYTKEGSEGIYTFTFDKGTGECVPIDTVASGPDPSFLEVAPNKKFVYAVNETNGGSVESFAFSEGKLTSLNMASSGGPHPCHVEIDKTGKWCIAGNYTGGSLAILPINDDGTLSEPTQVIQHTGSGPNKDRQNEPHVHSANISPNNKDVFVPDLGIDKVMAYRLNSETGELTAGNHQTVSAGSGPRHFTFHPNGKYAYVIQELTNTITAFDYTDGKLTEIEEVTTLPENFDGKSACADIHISPDGKFLYGSNRFSDTIVSYKIDEATGKLTTLNQTSVEGKTPRNFTISPTGKWVLVANQDSDNIVIFSRNTETGAITSTGKEIKVSMPVCLKWVK